MTYVWRIQDLFPILGTLKVVPLASLAAVALSTLEHDPRRSIRTLRNPVLTCALVVFALTVLSVPTSLYQGMSFRFITQDFGKTFVLMLLLAAAIRTFKDVERFAMVQVIGVGLYCFFIMRRFNVGANGRLDGLLYYDANDLGMLIVGSLPLVVYFLRNGLKQRTGLLALAILPISVMAIVKTGSRGAFLGLLAITVFMVLRFDAIPKRTRFGAVIGMVAILMLTANETYWDMMRTLLHPTEDYNWSGNAQSGRMEVWKRGIGYMLDRPLFGVGARAFPVAEGTISPLADRQEYGIGLKWSAAHNSFVQIGAELGVFGLASFIAMLVLAFRAMRRLGRSPPDASGRTTDRAALAQALSASLIGYAVTGFFLSQGYAVYLYAMIGIIIGLCKLAPEGVEQGAARPVIVGPATRPRSHYGRGTVVLPAARHRAPLRGQ